MNDYANGEFLFVYRTDEHRFQCTHLPTQRTIYSPEFKCFGYSVVEPRDAESPIVYGFTTNVGNIKAALTKWNPIQDTTITQHELSGRFETIIVSANGRRLAILHSDSGTISFYEAE